ncbi:hypothetical protein BLA29_006193 [Euroglyphus maynei]|uniref:Uncharacterized protein n=1 Tax=Euroglyphus maynei TaxID=6958 RepID=A0A1Y3B382_EURMA|nr:hypothetical protein BLA29_006193 [Euroglyphus maynei]
MSQPEIPQQSSQQQDGSPILSNTYSSGSSCSSKMMLSSNEGTVIHNKTADDCSSNVTNPDSTRFHLVIDLLNNIQMKSMLYEKDLKSIENLDFNIGDLLKSNVIDDEDDNVYVSKMIAKAREALKQTSVLSTAEYRHWIKNIDRHEECIEMFTEYIEDAIHDFKQTDLP